MLCLTEISSTTISIETSHNESATRSSAVFSRNQDEVLLEVDTVDGDKSDNDWYSKRCILNVLELG